LDSDIRALIESIHNTPEQTVVALAGAGSEALAWILSVPGASRTLLEALVPYGRNSMIGFLGHEPDQYVSPGNARDMAKAAYERALTLQEGNEPVLGLACTATLATDRPKRGDHRCCIATWGAETVATCNLVLHKGLRDRAGEEEVSSRLVLRALAEASSVAYDVPPLLTDGDQLEVARWHHSDPVRALTETDSACGVRTVTVHPDGRTEVNEPWQGAVLPGSFRPLHDGHLQLAEVASRTTEAPLAFELSVANVDKPPLTTAEVEERVRQFRGKSPVILTRAPTFLEKARLLPGCTIILGWDTAIRLVHPRYYGDDEGVMKAALKEIGALGCRILVAGRLNDGSFRELGDVGVPAEHAHLFRAIPEADFRADISSTEMRGGA
jgi:hypothetical protein